MLDAARMRGTTAAYVAVISEDSQNEFSIYFPDVPGCFTRGATRDQACRFAGETLAFHLERFAANGTPWPVMQTVEHLRAQPEHRNATFILVEPTVLTPDA